MTYPSVSPSPSLHYHSADILLVPSGMVDECSHFSMISTDLSSSSSSTTSESDACLFSNASLQSPLMRNLHLCRMNETKNVRFSRVVQVREITQRKDMSPSEVWDRWGVDQRIDSTIFDPVHADSEDTDVTILEKKLHRLRRREAWVIRRKFLCEWEASQRNGVNQVFVDINYSQDSRLKAIDAHHVALMLSRELEQHAFDLSGTSDRAGTPPEGKGSTCRQRGFSPTEFSPCRPAKRQRSSV